ncbi:hypothetical protein SZ25_00818 [Candidatus Arcanobacter lacustris]|uniref:Uncharacterized protein n=1 Tax=Candidatus Arcanibacter lacustris TaxID=1607817 RepID=A0A0F5MMQ5_9RICK|nr:hypothetical protein SZ25_00818 [Candidatus Arcanobacter lacustris]
MEKEIAKNSNTNFIEEGVGYIYNNPVYCISVGLVSYGVFSVGGTLLSSYFCAQQLYQNVRHEINKVGSYIISARVAYMMFGDQYDDEFVIKALEIYLLDAKVDKPPELSTLGLASLSLGLLGVSYTSLLGDNQSLKTNQETGEF